MKWVQLSLITLSDLEVVLRFSSAEPLLQSLGKTNQGWAAPLTKIPTVGKKQTENLLWRLQGADVGKQCLEQQLREHCSDCPAVKFWVWLLTGWLWASHLTVV